MRSTLVFGAAALTVLITVATASTPNPRVAGEGGSQSLNSQLLPESRARLQADRLAVSPTATLFSPTPLVPSPTATAVVILAKPTIVPVQPAAAVEPGSFIGTFRISFYTCAENPNCQDGWPNSATIATDPARIPRGSCVIIEGIGQKIVDDAGGGIKGDRIDVFLPAEPEESMSSVHQRALALGIVYRDVSRCN